MTPLVNLQDVVAHLNLDDCDTGALNAKILQASATVMTHLKLTAMSPAWADDPNASPLTYTVPFDIQAATLLLIGELWENRESGRYDPSENWKRFLVPHRVPTLA